MDHKNSYSASYAAAGVDITAGYRAVELMKKHVARTRNEGCLDDVGGFGGCFGLGSFAGMEEPVLVSGTDGCGTKVKLAILMNKHDTIGIDAVAMCVNDIICVGAKPLFFLDYIACGKNVPEKIAQIVGGVAEGCVQSGAALIGGETAEHPGMMPVEDYSLAINNYKKYGTDMWNPHLGNNLHKRGYLPYMNEEMEKECDVKVVKALLYGFQNGRIVYKDGMGEAQDRYYFECDNKKITDAEGRWINNKNVAQLFNWIRNEDELVDEWSALFDRDIARQMNALPSLASGNSTEISTLETGLTGTSFMKLLTESLYVDTSAAKLKVGKRVKLDKGRKPELVQRVGPTALEFAYMIKTSEEQGRDCDDAERILNVIYQTFRDLCSYRTNIDSNPESFIQVYKQQLGNVYESLASAKIVYAAGSSCRAQFKQITTWFNQAGVFNTISADMPMDDKGRVCINQAFRVEDSADVKKILDFINKSGKAIADDDDEAEPAAVEVQEDDE